MTSEIDYTVLEIAEIADGILYQQGLENTLQHLLLDSRKLSFAQHTIFFALGNDATKNQFFVDELYKKGVTNFVVDDRVKFDRYIAANFIVVKNPLKVFQSLAIHHRRKLYFISVNKPLPVIGIAGSNGKTIVKEWLNQLLENDFNIVRSPKSYNSQVGVPLSILQINASHTLGIFEAGISRKGEMDVLEKIIQPTIGIFTNIGTAHDEGFSNVEEKISEKLKLFTHCSTIIFCSNHSKLSSTINKFIKNEAIKKDIQFFNWGKNDSASLQINSVKKKSGQSTITAIFRQKKISISIPFADDASIENAIHCWCVMLLMNVDDRSIAERMKYLFAIEMRLELKEGINNCAIINDSYSADINSLVIALDFLSQQQQHPKHTIILSDVLQSGKSDEQLYGEIAAILKQKRIHKLIAIGSRIGAERHQFSSLEEKYFFISSDEFEKEFHSLHFSNETILIKGARVFAFERINKLLEQKVHQTILSINLDAIAHNLKQYRSQLQPDTMIMAMVKAFSYGSGSFEVAALLQFHKADYLGVAYADEGVELRKAGITLPIMVMNPEENTFSVLAEYDLEPEIFSFSMLDAFEKYLLSSGIDYYPVHIKLDTGMHRLGFESHDVERLAMHLSNSKRVKIKSVFSHLVASENPAEDEFTFQQFKSFTESCDILQNSLGYSFLKHIANTSSISRHPGLQLDMVRLGIGLYGLDSNPAMQSNLKNVTTLTTTVAQIKKVKKGETVGYGRHFKLENDTTVATVRIGYADGYSRRLSNGNGKMLLKNILVPVIGNVCMDMTMLDITGIPGIKEGERVIVFGEGIPIQYLARWSGSIAYEIMTGISQRVKRIYFQE